MGHNTYLTVYVRLNGAHILEGENWAKFNFLCGRTLTNSARTSGKVLQDFDGPRLGPNARSGDL
jgi:hypothetical protein